MTTTPDRPVIEVPPTPTVYTVLMLIALLALWTSVGLSVYRLTSPVGATADVSGGYGMEIGDILTPAEELPAIKDARAATQR
jgi:hypothetical protein